MGGPGGFFPEGKGFPIGGWVVWHQSSEAEKLKPLDQRCALAFRDFYAPWRHLWYDSTNIETS
jgi:hypothetical protein